MKSLVIYLLLNFGLLCSDWNALNIIETNSAFLELEQKISDFVKNSWCSEEKNKGDF